MKSIIKQKYKKNYRATTKRKSHMKNKKMGKPIAIQATQPSSYSSSHSRRKQLRILESKRESKKRRMRYRGQYMSKLRIYNRKKHFRRKKRFFINLKNIKKNVERANDHELSSIREDLNITAVRRTCRLWNRHLVERVDISDVYAKANKLINVTMRHGRKKTIINIYDKIRILIGNILSLNIAETNDLLQKMMRRLSFIGKISQPVRYRPPHIRVPKIEKRLFYGNKNLLSGVKKKTNICKTCTS